MHLFPVFLLQLEGLLVSIELLPVRPLFILDPLLVLGKLLDLQILGLLLLVEPLQFEVKQALLLLKSLVFFLALHLMSQLNLVFKDNQLLGIHLLFFFLVLDLLVESLKYLLEALRADWLLKLNASFFESALDHILQSELLLGLVNEKIHLLRRELLLGGEAHFELAVSLGLEPSALSELVLLDGVGGAVGNHRRVAVMALGLTYTHLLL